MLDRTVAITFVSCQHTEVAGERTAARGLDTGQPDLVGTEIHQIVTVRLDLSRSGRSQVISPLQVASLEVLDQSGNVRLRLAGNNRIEILFTVVSKVKGMTTASDGLHSATTEKCRQHLRVFIVGMQVGEENQVPIAIERNVRFLLVVDLYFGMVWTQ